MKEFIAQFEKLLAEGKLEEAKKSLAGLASLPVSKEERGDADVVLTRLYLKLTNALNQNYLETLEDATATLKALRVREKKFEEEAALARTRASLAQAK